MPPVIADPADPTTRLVLLDERYKDETLADLPEKLTKFIRESGLSVVKHSLQLDSKNYTTGTSLKGVIIYLIKTRY